MPDHRRTLPGRALSRRIVAIGAGLTLAGLAAAYGTSRSGSPAAPAAVVAPGAEVSAAPPSAGAPTAGVQQLGPASYVTGSPTPGTSSSPASKAASSALPGWGSPVAVEDFTGSLSGDWGKYDTVDGNPPRSGDQVSVSGGMLHIAGGYNSRVGKDVGGGVMYLKDLKYGRFEVRFRVQAGAGYAGVVLMWPKENADWPTVGEIDLAEITNPTRGTFGSFLHHGSANHKVGVDATKADFTAFHTLAVEWLPNRVTYFLDGKKYFNVTPGELETGLPTESPLHLALQLDQGCDDFIPCRNAQTPDKVMMDVDWVKIYKAQS